MILRNNYVFTVTKYMDNTPQKPKCILINRINIISPKRRNMMSRMKILAPSIVTAITSVKHHNPETTIRERHFATWQGMVRTKPPLPPKHAPNCFFRDKELGLKILPLRDFSGANHSFLCDLDFEHPIYVKTYGVFTSQSHEIHGQRPEMIDRVQFSGKASPQFFLRYAKPKLLVKVHVEVDWMVYLDYPHIKEFLSTINA